MSGEALDTHVFVFAHVREAIRCWAAHNEGRRVDRARGGAQGRGCSTEDCVRVGRVLVTARVTESDKKILIRHARGMVREDKRINTLLKRLRRYLRDYGLLEGPSRAPSKPLYRDEWVDAEGNTRTTVTEIQ